MSCAPAEQPALTETHISVLGSIGDRVYKLKKPVSFGFIDFSDRRRREQACHREVELNRRLAPDVYLGVADVLGVDGEPCDHLVVMQRTPAELRLAALVRSGAPLADLLAHIAHRDASWSADRHRQTAREISGATSSDLVELRCVVPDGVAERRIRERLAAGGDASDATPAVAAAMAARFDPWPESTPVDTDGPVDATVARAKAAAVS